MPLGSSSEEEMKEKSVVDGSIKLRSRAMSLSLISLSAALYAIAIALTSPIPTPWGVGHFRPGVVIPAFFAVVFGPVIGGVGAAIGCFIGDFALSFFGFTTPLLSLIAGVPGNFVGFYLLGYLVSKYRSWASFVLNSFIALMVGNLIAALGVLGYFWFIVYDWASWPMDLKISVTVGLTFFWVVTMIVFVVPLVPIFVTGVEPILIKMGVKGTSIRRSKPADIIKSSSVVSIILAGLYALVMYVPGGNQIFSGSGLPPELLILVSAIIFVFGLIFAYFAGK
jgi:uncharacterized membrane protein